MRQAIALGFDLFLFLLRSKIPKILRPYKYTETLANV